MSKGDLLTEIPPKNGNRFKDLTGKKFGKLTVLSLAKRGERGLTYWLCQCDCGNTTTVRGPYLNSGHTKSCNCIRRQYAAERLSILNRKPHGYAGLTKLLAGYKNGAIRRGLSFNLTREQMYTLSQMVCFYCGCAPNQRSISSEKSVKLQTRLESSLVYNGVDRVDNDIGYEPANCVSCCWQCNSAKSDLTKDEFLSWVARVNTHTKKEAV